MRARTTFAWRVAMRNSLEQLQGAPYCARRTSEQLKKVSHSGLYLKLLNVEQLNVEDQISIRWNEAAGAT